jgi:hypothetical protein
MHDVQKSSIQNKPKMNLRKCFDTVNGQHSCP